MKNIVDEKQFAWFYIIIGGKANTEHICPAESASQKNKNVILLRMFSISMKHEHKISLERQKLSAKQKSPK